MLVLDVNKRLTSYKTVKEDGDDFIFDSFANFRLFHLKDQYIIPNEKHYEFALKEIKEHTYINLTLEQVKTIYSFYPYEKIELAVNDEVEFSIISHFFLGCPWPLYKDNVDIKEFLEMLHFQVKKIYPDVTFISLEKDN